MPPSPRSPSRAGHGSDDRPGHLRDDSALVDRLREQLADATATACKAYQDNARLVRVLSVIAQPSAPEKLSDQVLTVISQTFNASVVCLVRLVGDRLIVTDGCGLPEDDPAYTEGWPASKAAVEALSSGEAIGTAAAEPDGADPDVPAPLAGLGVRSAAWVPMRSGDGLDNELLVIYRSTGEPMSLAELRLLESVAFRLTVAVESSERTVLAQRLADSGHRLTRHLNHDSLFREVPRLLRELLSANDAWAIVIKDGLAQRPRGKTSPGWPCPAATLPGWQTIQAGQPYRDVICQWPDLDPSGQQQPVALLCVPVARDELPASLLYATRDVSRPFLDYEVEAATTFAYYLRSAMINAELYQAMRRSETILRHRASHDALTGLANRELANQQLTEALDRAEPSRVGLLFCDLDRFKAVNDRLGHDVGDELLKMVADRLRRCMRRGDLLARLGGDEFVFVLDGVRDLSDVLDVGRRVTSSLLEPFELADELIRVSVSVGGVCGTRGRTTAVAMLRDADAAMYTAKGRGHGLVEIFDDDASLRSLDRLDLRSDLEYALERRQLSVCYQPIIDLPTDRIVGFEALVRWNHPTRGLISPELFIPLAEESGAIIPIGAWVLRQACLQLVSWQRLPRWRRLGINVNLSAVQLRELDLAGELLSTIRATHADPADVWLEVTEHSSMRSDVTECVTGLRDVGVHFALDDFGISYSNLNHLRHFPVENLKIDRSFVAGLTPADRGSGIDLGIVRAILAIADSLGLTVTAEGIETEEQRRCLIQLGCHRGQGYLFSKPLPPSEATALLVRASQGDGTCDHSLTGNQQFRTGSAAYPA
ncbi:MAG: EAL domain-containing protein [Micromonosporaceae bacterium]|nr:EAL domain-containing protein [Micromonosporaceae bacterium]